MTPMQRDPLTKQRSAWTYHGDQAVIGLDEPSAWWTRNVHDGHLTALIDTGPDGGAHMSLSHRTNHTPPRPGRYPTWDEIADARDELLPAGLGFVMHLPPSGEYVACHPTTFHLHQYPAPEKR